MIIKETMANLMWNQGKDILSYINDDFFSMMKWSASRQDLAGCKNYRTASLA